MYSIHPLHDYMCEKHLHVKYYPINSLFLSTCLAHYILPVCCLQKLCKARLTHFSPHFPLPAASALFSAVGFFVVVVVVVVVLVVPSAAVSVVTVTHPPSSHII
jgi:hypothetical protein